MTLLVIQGAALLLSSSPPAARHVIHSAFDRQGHGKQLVNMLFLSHDLCICAYFFACFESWLSHTNLILEIEYFKINRLQAITAIHVSVKVGVDRS